MKRIASAVLLPLLELFAVCGCRAVPRRLLSILLASRSSSLRADIHTRQANQCPAVYVGVHHDGQGIRQQRAIKTDLSNRALAAPACLAVLE
ncbi:hypothetical protein BD779DRAFT_291636 [Infundibulicybe gibba]|nr:hypothetical protein BD779DRAFT_291636 [Infundibulicybe gibba]